MSGETEQEKAIRTFLVENGIAFKQHYRVLGYGQKIWVVDFYLPEHGIIIEAKELNYIEKEMRSTRHTQGIYRDLYKLDELIERYGLIGIICLKVPLFIFPKTFIPNLNEHFIYCITEPCQILSIIQKQKVEKVNSTFHPPPPIKIEEPKVKRIFEDSELQMLWDWSKGKNCKKLGLHNMQLHRKLKRFVAQTMENQNKLDSHLERENAD